ncbi:hypothetical protein [Micromonospora sp. NPDC023814]|uniref:hypothetical protein n=1 Tax=Micromonospora sp. NPDC023814 TaxID=3154596 RepID=UPI00340F7B75
MVRRYEDVHRFCVSMGPISGMRGVADELMRYLGYEPRDYPEVANQLAEAIGDETLDLGRQILAEHNLPERDSVGLGAPAAIWQRAA